jgi:hypothetical protein
LIPKLLRVSAVADAILKALLASLVAPRAETYQQGNLSTGFHLDSVGVGFNGFP